MNAPPVFEVVVLGCGGGPMETNLSGYLVAAAGSNSFLAVDAGSLLAGIEAGRVKGSFPEIAGPAETILRQNVKAYLISHAHLDHVAGLVINSQCDSTKPLFGIASTIDNIRDHLFNWKIWPNFADEGTHPHLGQYTYKRLALQQTYALEGTSFFVEPFLLSHPDNYPSTAFLLRHQSHYLLYVGDTSPDCLEKKRHLRTIWQRVAPLVHEGVLKGMFLECSYAEQRDSTELFGHLRPDYVMQELQSLARLASPEAPTLNGLKVVVTHIKEHASQGESAALKIQKELAQFTSLNCQFLFPSQGDRLLF